MEKYANMKTKCLRHKGLNHTEAGRGGGYFRGWFQLVCLVRLRYNCIHIGKAVKVGLLQFDVNIVNNVNIANVSIVKITKIAPSASIVYQFLVFFQHGWALLLSSQFGLNWGTIGLLSDSGHPALSTGNLYPGWKLSLSLSLTLICYI